MKFLNFFMQQIFDVIIKLYSYINYKKYTNKKFKNFINQNFNCDIYNKYRLLAQK